jgi:hypothetical protein
VKEWLHQASLASPELPIAGEQAIPLDQAQDVVAETGALILLLSELEHSFDVVGVKEQEEAMGA